MVKETTNFILHQRNLKSGLYFALLTFLIFLILKWCVIIWIFFSCTNYVNFSYDILF